MAKSETVPAPRQASKVSKRSKPNLSNRDGITNRITQVRNTSTGNWIVRENHGNGRFSVKASKTQVAGIEVRHALLPAPSPALSREVAEKAEKAVLAYINKHK